MVLSIAVERYCCAGITYIGKDLDCHRNIINKLTSEGILLSQINALYNPKAESANVTFDYYDNFTCAEWFMNEAHSSKIIQNAEDENNLGEIGKKLLEN